MATQYVNCQQCGAPNDSRNVVCLTCGNALQMIGAPMQPAFLPKPPGSEKKILAGILGIVFGGLGIHKFVLGYTTEGIIMCVVYVAGMFFCGLPALAIAIVGIVEGVIYLTKTDEEFVRTYIINKKPWF